MCTLLSVISFTRPPACGGIEGGRIGFVTDYFNSDLETPPRPSP